MSAQTKRRSKETERVLTKWEKAFTRDAEWQKEELEDVVHWVRQVLGGILGLLWGFLGLEGFVGIGSFGLANVLIMFLYYTKYLGVDDEEFGRTELVQEGFMSSFAIFLICWISVYNLFL